MLCEAGLSVRFGTDFATNYERHMGYMLATYAVLAWQLGVSRASVEEPSQRSGSTCRVVGLRSSLRIPYGHRMGSVVDGQRA
jgi:hypothetical protein